MFVAVVTPDVDACKYWNWFGLCESSEEVEVTTTTTTTTVEQTEQIRLCKYQCEDTKRLRKQFCSSCTHNACPETYAEFVSTGMLVCTELTTTEISTTEATEATEYDCDYSKCKRYLYAYPDDLTECSSTYLFDDKNCTTAGDKLIDVDEMFIEIQNVY